MVARICARRIGALGSLLLVGLGAGPHPASAQWSAKVSVREEAGIRRTSFPARIRTEIPEGRLGYVSQVRLSDGASEVPSQGTAWSTWPDGSIRDLEVDFNLSIGPLEERTLQLFYGPDVSATAAVTRGLLPRDGEEGIEIGRVRLHRVGSPLLASVAYREEAIGRGRNGISIVERSGIRRDAREIMWEPFEILKGGPITALVRYRGRVTLSGGNPADITLDVEMPNSKSWLKLSLEVSDPGERVGHISIETPLDLGAYPWTWDVATPNGTYGAFRDPTGSVLFSRTVGGERPGAWEVRAGAAGSEQLYEQSRPGDERPSPTWIHFTGPDEAVAFAVEPGAEAAGTIEAWLAGTGQTTVGFRSEEPATRHAITIYQHYVAPPVPIGAATSPASILSPLVVTVE